MRLLAILIAVALPVCMKAQDYNVALIPDSLKENANAVTRFEEAKLIIHSGSSATYKHKYAITVLNEAGAHYADYHNSYSKLMDLSNIDGALYDAAGKKIKEVKRKDIGDVSINDGFSLMRDSRIKHHNFYYAQYPYTIEYEDEQDFNGLIGLPIWMPADDQKYGVQQSRLIIEAPLDYHIRFKQTNYPGKPLLETKGKTVFYTWELKNFKPFVHEPFQPIYKEVVPAVYVAPSHFSYGGYSGEMDSWLNYGKYQVELNKGRDVLPENIKKEVHAMVDGLSSREEKIKVLYRYLQSNTRYISIQLGIGGLQPFDASYVATNKYGDCKALSNYMVALLKEAGIKGYYSIINAGENEKFYLPDFPSDQTNHIIVSVPLEKDTMWLECTSQTQAPGYMGSFTDDRYALLIKEDGGYLVKTPAYKKDENLQFRNVEGTLNETGQLVVDVKTKYKGLEQDDLQMMINSIAKDKVIERMKHSLDLPTYDLRDLNYKEFKDVVPSLDETYKLTVDNYATVSGKRLFVVPNLLTRESYKLDERSDRKFDVVYNYSFKHVDTVSLKIPEGYSLEALPKDLTINNKFGTFALSVKVDKNNIFFVRNYERSSGRFPPSDYSQLVKFYEDMYKADRCKIVFVKNQ
jgi:hypothetical protein